MYLGEPDPRVGQEISGHTSVTVRGCGGTD